MEDGRPLGMLMTAVSRHRRLRWQLCQLHHHPRSGVTGSDGAEGVRYGAPARVEQWLCSRKSRHPWRMGSQLKLLVRENRAKIIMDP